jgi:hypothetical protein
VCYALVTTVRGHSSLIVAGGEACSKALWNAGDQQQEEKMGRENRALKLHQIWF